MAYGDSFPARSVVDVAPNDSADLATPARALYVGAGGTLKLTALDSGTVTLAGVVAGSIVPIATKRVWATGTTAASIVALL